MCVLVFHPLMTLIFSFFVFFFVSLFLSSSSSAFSACSPSSDVSCRVHWSFPPFATNSLAYQRRNQVEGQPPRDLMRGFRPNLSVCHFLESVSYIGFPLSRLNNLFAPPSAVKFDATHWPVRCQNFIGRW